jgi:putative flippase GtrA
MPELNEVFQPVVPEKGNSFSLVEFLKNDLTIAAIVGILCALLMLPVLKNIFPQVNFYYFLTLIIVLPILAVAGMWVAVFIGKKIAVIYQLAKFVLVGALNTFLDWGVLNLLMFLVGIYSGGLYVFFKGISFLVSCTSSYFWNKFWTFKKSSDDIVAAEEKTQSAEFIQFFIVSIIAMSLNLAVATLLVNVIGPQFGASKALWANFGALAGTLVGMTWNFLGYKLIVFKK